MGGHVGAKLLFPHAGSKTLVATAFRMVIRHKWWHRCRLLSVFRWSLRSQQEMVCWLEKQQFAKASSAGLLGWS